MFFVNVPIGMLIFALTFLLVPDPHTGRAHRLDLTGVLLSTVALTCVTFALGEGGRYSWNAGIRTLGATGLALAALFLRQQSQRQKSESPSRSYCSPTAASLLAGLVSFCAGLLTVIPRAWPMRRSP
ncbi:hypothetical protein [Streptomyces sp. NPDC093970]|uniref:hypothetical protein n=1 Tax=Streptomyces sp. NPDC093970 TaxID=3155076 RepID=UPI003422AA63